MPNFRDLMSTAAEHQRERLVWRIMAAVREYCPDFAYFLGCPDLLPNVSETLRALPDSQVLLLHSIPRNTPWVLARTFQIMNQELYATAREIAGIAYVTDTWDD